MNQIPCNISFLQITIWLSTPPQVQFREIPSHVLSKVCMYFAYKNRYTNSTSEIPEFPIEPEIALELLMAANFLDCWICGPGPGDISLFI